jgi:ribosomal peptide maturation radical SAM protein 1
MEASGVHSSDAPAQNDGEVALICMPWTSLESPSIAMGLLKRYVTTAGFIPELYYLNISFAKRIGLRLYEQIARSGDVHTEWFFSQALFGPQGTGELDNGWQRIRSARSFVETFTNGLGLSEDECERLASEHVPAFIDEYATAVDWSKYTVVGFTTMFAQSLSTLLLAQRIKQKHPDVKIVLGGANVEAEMGVEVMRAFDWIDFVVHGEGEYSFPLLLKNIATGKTDERIPGVSTRQGGEVLRGDLTPPPTVDVNDVPAPDYSDYLVEMELTGFEKALPITLWFESSRGCWWGAKHHCTFCGLNGTTMAYRRKDADKVYSEIVELANTHRCLRLAAADNIFANEYFTELLPKLAELGSDIRLFYSVKANLRRDQLNLMAEAGIESIQPGIESFNSRLLQLMRKGVSAIQNIQLLKWCREIGIHVCYNILYRFPQETPDDYKNLPTIFSMLGHLQPPGDMVPVVIERFSPYFFDKERFNLQYRPRPEYEGIYPTPRVDIPKLAYFFHGWWTDQVGEPEEYIAPAKASLREWKTHAANDGVFCHYEKGPDYVRVHDNRPHRSAGPLLRRTFDLDEQLSALLVFCDQNRSFQAIVTMMQTRFGTDVTEGIVRNWLDDLVAQWLMFQEGDRYLTLAVRKKRRDG